MPVVLGALVLFSLGVAPSSALPVLEITKVDDVDPVDAGENVTYTITVTNTGDQPASNVTVDDTLPSGFSVVSVTSSDGTCSALPCNLGSMGSGGPTSTKTVSVVARVDPATPAGTYANTATVDSDETSLIATVENTSVTTSAVLTVTKADSPDPVPAGGTLTYTVTVTNTGPSDADLVTVTDTLPTDVSFVSATASAPDPGASCIGGATVSCDLGTLEPSGPNNVATVTVVVDVSTSAAGTLSNSASADSAEPEGPVTSTAATTSVGSSADLTLVKTDSPDPVQANSQLTYTVTVTNTGPSDAQSIDMDDNLPSGTAFVSVSGPGSCTNTASKVSCSLNTLSAASPNNVAVWTITVSVPTVGGPISDGTVLSNSASVSAVTTDPDLSTNSYTETTTVVAPVIDLTKSADPPSGSDVSSGQTITYTIVYVNSGSGTATNFIINDPVSTFLSDVVPANGGTYDPGTRTITWSIGDVPPGGSGSVTFTARVGSSTKQRESIINRANAISNELSNPVVSNRTDHDLVAPDVRVDKRANRPENSVVKPGDVVTYELEVLNRGADTTGVVVTDTPPPHMIYVPGSTRLDGAPVGDVAGSSQLFAGGIVIDLDKNERKIVTFQMVVNVTAPAGSVIENWGYATSNSGQSVSGDFFDLVVFRPTTGPTLRQSVLVQSAEGETIFVSVFNSVVSLLPVTGYQIVVFALLGFSSIGFGRSLSSRIAPDLFRRKKQDDED